MTRYEGSVVLRLYFYSYVISTALLIPSHLDGPRTPAYAIPRSSGSQEQTKLWQHTFSLLATMTTLAFSRRPSLAFSDFGSDDEEQIDANGADYSTRMGELFDDENETSAVSLPQFGPDEDGEDEEAFVYDGVDAQTSRASYREQLRDVLDDDDDELEEREVEHSLVHDPDRPLVATEDEASVSPLPHFVQSTTLVRRLFRVAARLLPTLHF
jgi:hypothetical protein